MAQDIFAPKSSFNIGYERPVARPVEDTRGETQAKFQAMSNEMEAAQIRSQTQVDKAKSGIARTIFGGVADLAGGYAQKQAMSQSSGVAKSWLDGMQTAQDLRDQGKLNEATLFERKVTKEAVSSGLDLDKYKTEYEAVTGRPMEYVGQTREQQAFEMMKSDQSFQMAYFAAQGRLGQGATEEQLMTEALTSVRKQAIASDTLALVGAGNQLDWETQVKGAYSTVLDQFDNSIVAGLVKRTQDGQPITPGEIDTVLMQHNLMSQKLIKPAYVSDEQWNEVKQRLTLQKEFLTSIKNSRDPDNMLTDMVSQMMQSAETPLDAMAVAAASDPSNLVATLGINIPEVMNTVAGSAFTDNNWKKRGQIVSDLQAADVTTPVNGNSTFTTETTPAFLQPYLNLDKGVMKKNVDAGVAMLSSVKPMELQNEDTRKQFYNGVMSVTAGMLSDKQFYSSSVVSKVFNNPNLKQSLDMVASVDRESADEMRIAIRSAAGLQMKAVEGNLSTIETTMEFGGYTADLQWDEADNRYYITNDQAIRHGVQILGSGGVSDKGLYIDPKLPVAPRGLEDAYDRRKSMVVLERAMNDLAIEGADDDMGMQLPEGDTVGILDFISSGEGGYGASNRGTKGSTIVGSELGMTTRGGKNLTEMTLGEIMRFQAIKDPDNPDRLFAVGAYQFIPSTLKSAMESAGLSKDTVFTPDVQDRLGIELLIGSKRPKLAAYIKGESNDIEAAMTDFAKEWASAPDPKTGKSRYGSGNKAKHSVAETRQALQRARQAYSEGILTTELPPAGGMSTNELIDTAEGAINDSSAPTESLRPQIRPEQEAASEGTPRPRARPLTLEFFKESNKDILEGLSDEQIALLFERNFRTE